jgi:sec-independent protein translocase protein TatC
MAEESDPFRHTRMTLGEHLRELRTRLFRSVLALFIAFIGCWFAYEPLFHFVTRPMIEILEKIDAEKRAEYEARLAEEQAADPSVRRSKYFRSDDPEEKRLHRERTVPTRMTSVGMGDQFSIALRITLIAALVAAMPVILWQMWQFVAAGLYPHERRGVLRFFPISIGLFAAGVVFGFEVMCPYGFEFMVRVFDPEDVEYIASAGPYLDWLQGVTLALGLVFELPIVMYVLVRTGLVERGSFARFRRYFVVASFVIGGMLTPPDPITQFLAAIPMILLYEIGLAWTWFLPIAREQRQAARA